MPQTRIIQTNLSAGEVSPRLFGRVDIEQYANGAAEVFNMVVLPGGGATRRSGSYDVAAQKDTNTRVKLVPFRVSARVAYVLEFGVGYVRFFHNRGPLLDSLGDPLEIETPYEESELRELRFAQSADVMFITHPNHQPRKISRTLA